MELLPIGFETCMHLRESLLPLADIPLSHTAALITGKDTLRNPSPPQAAYNRRSHSPRAFAPLTPIIASPRCSPSTSMSSIVNSSYERTENKSSTALPATRDIHISRSSRNLSLDTTVISPSWISTPPTPLELHSSLALEVCSSQKGWPETITSSESYPAVSFTPECRADRQKRRASAPPISYAKFSTLIATQFTAPLSSIPRQGSPSCAPAAKSSEDISTISPESPLLLSTSPKPMFHIPRDASDNEDECIHGRPEHPEMSRTPPGHDLLDAVRKDDTKRYYSLVELLTTEMGYLLDLRVLVKIFLRGLLARSAKTSSIPCRSDSSPLPGLRPLESLVPSLSSTTPPTLPTQLLPHGSNVTTGCAETPIGEISKEKSKRHLLTSTEFERVSRNAEEILQLHEHFVDDLKNAVSPLGFATFFDHTRVGADMDQGNLVVPATERIDEAIRIVATKFAVESDALFKASRFNVYQCFCSTHSEVFVFLQKLQQQHPVEWDAFEGQSSLLILDFLYPDFKKTRGSVLNVNKDLPELPANFSTFWHATGHKKRSHSLSSLEDSPSALGTFSSSHASSTASKPNESRLTFMDYLIKPIQRICKYPLLLEGLKGKTAATVQAPAGWSPSSSETFQSNAFNGPDVNVVVESASQAMRHVASMVDEAGRRQTVFVQSALIASRIHLAWAASHSSSVHQAFHLLTPNFVTSLGPCVIVGALVVMHFHSAKSPALSCKAKYLGAFLYAGGYLVLAKVLKGKAYEPRHWFSLIGFDLTDLQDEDAKLPCSFLLSCNGHHLILAASCQREKEVWISAINESLSTPPTWTNEPTSSLRFDEKGEIIDLDGGPYERLSPLPTIQSMPDVDEGADITTTLGHNVMEHHHTPARNEASRSNLSQYYRSSSVKSIFASLSMDSSSIVRRPSQARRVQVDRGLDDVISESCRMVRYHASVHESDVLYGSKPPRSSFGKSASALSLSKLGRRESVLVPRQRGSEGPSIPLESANGQSKQSALRPKALSLSMRTKRLRLPMPVAFHSEDDDGIVGWIERPKPRSAESSGTASHYSSNPASPINGDVVGPSTIDGTEGRPKRTRSMVENVRGLFYMRSASPTLSITSLSHPDKPRSLNHDNEIAHHKPCMLNSAPGTPALLKWWSKGTLRRRVRSSPDVPAQDI